MSATTKDPAKVRAGKIGARVRWGEPRTPVTVRLDSLDTATRHVIILLIEAAKAAAAKAEEAQS